MIPALTWSASAADIKLAVAWRFRITCQDLVSDQMTVAVVRPRQIAMWLCRRSTPLSLVEIGREFGKRDHTTVIHAINRVDGFMACDRELADIVWEILETIDQPSAAALRRSKGRNGKL